jgi:exodeoxyribonuclease V alpha subunit
MPDYSRPVSTAPIPAALFEEEANPVPGAAWTGRVEVLRQVFRAEEDGYAVLAVRDESGDDFTVIGPVGHLNAGDRAEVTGTWQEHARYGAQLRATGALPLDPADRAGQLAYLTSLRYIGPARAEALLDRHGDDVLDAIARDPAGVFGAVRGISARQAEAAAESWHSSRAVRDLHVQLAPHGLAHLAAPIHARFGTDAMRVLHQDPYALTAVDGVGFARADTIALAGDMPPESDRRAQAAAEFALAEAEKSGHTHLPVEPLRRRAADLLGLEPEIDVLLAAPGVVVEEGRVYREGTHACEVWCARTLAARAAAPSNIAHEPGPEPRDGLTDEQWAAVRGAFAARLSVVTGGPGVGKTVCIKTIVSEARAAQLKVALAAPTGRAARRMEEATGRPAATIHRLLEWMPGREPAYRPGHPLPADLVVVDEASMINLRLAEVLLGGLAETTHVVFVGDADQLPPVGAGKPFADLIASGLVPVVRLTQIFRQAARSMITTAAHAVNRGRPPALEPQPGQQHDFHFLDRASPERALDAVVELVAERVGGGLGLDPVRDAQVLAPMYRTPVGIDALNERLQARLNPDGRPALNERFRVGDRLIQTRNSHELGLMNGSICFLAEDDPDEGTIVLETDEGGSLVVPYDDAIDLRLAYAISVHKAQGCEVPVVVFVCHRSHSRMLTRPLLYTAITRAKRTCVLVGDPGALAAAVRRDEGSGRHSSLARRLAPR